MAYVPGVRWNVPLWLVSVRRRSTRRTVASACSAANGPPSTTGRHRRRPSLRTSAGAAVGSATAAAIPRSNALRTRKASDADGAEPAAQLAPRERLARADRRAEQLVLVAPAVLGGREGELVERRLEL